MLRALGLRSGPTLSQDEINRRIVDQALQLETALKAMDYVLDDRADEAFKLLQGHESVAISQLAYGVVQFLEATLGFEQDTMKKASESLSLAESLSWKEKTFNEKNNIKVSSIYPPGTEFAVAYAEANLLNALLMLLSENFMEGARALLKLRRAYHTLDAISKNCKVPLHSSSASLASLSLSDNNSDKSSRSSFIDIPRSLSEQELKDRDIVASLDRVYHMRTSRLGGSHIGNPPVEESLRSDLGFQSPKSSSSAAASVSKLSMGNPDVSSVDEYIHSGVNLCFGILQVVLSLIPQGIGKVLSVVGFKGSREAGLQMVWNAAMERNIHGGIGLLALLVFYDGPFQFTDVDFDIPSVDEMNKSAAAAAAATISSSASLSSKGDTTKTNLDLAKKRTNLERTATMDDHITTLLHPGDKLVQVLLHARALFPHSNLWLLQESRMLASRGRLREAVDMMDSANKSQMKQVDALLGFDRSMILVFLHDFDRAGKDFVDLVKINSYSHALYIWFAGACYLEAYRMCLTNCIPPGCDVKMEKMDQYAQLAEKYLLEAPKLIGRKKFLSKVPPFEKLIDRKFKEIMSIKSSHPNLKLIDCVGTSLVHELAYFWNGYNRMSKEHLELTIKLLGYSSTTSAESSNGKDKDLSTVDASGKSFAKIKESGPQKLIRLSLQSLSLRRLGQIERGMKILDDQVIPKFINDKLTNDPWLYPTVLYERALFCWKLNGVNGLNECMSWLKKSQVYGGDDYELSTRVTMKTKAAVDRLEDLNV